MNTNQTAPQTTDPRMAAATAAAAAALKEYDAKAENATPGNPPDDLPRNRDGMPEFSVVTLTFDHLYDKPDNHVRNKMLYSTETMPEAIANLMGYYGIRVEDAQSQARILEVVGEAAKEEYSGGILVMYAANGNPNDAQDRGPVIEVLLSTPSYYDLIEHPDFGKGSSLLASSELIGAVWNALKSRQDAAGRFPVLTYLKLMEADYAAPVVDAPAEADPPAADAPNSTTAGQHFVVDPRDFPYTG